MKSRIHLSPLLRKIALSGLRLFGDHDVSITHAWHPGRSVSLNIYRHKGYWYHRKNRERELMISLQRLAAPGMQAVEIGGHIGWITIHLAELVGPSGSVQVFEPSPANLPYLKSNTASLSNVQIIEAAASDRDGTAAFYMEELTGQNDTLIMDYQVFKQNRSLAFSNSTYKEITVRTVCLDTELALADRRIDIIKIDVEGAEDQVLHGARNVLSRDQPMLAVEITRERPAILSFLEKAGYRSFSTALRPTDPSLARDRNFIFLHPDRHSAHLDALVGATAEAAG